MSPRESFNEAAVLYDEVRPTYPDSLIDLIVQKTTLQKTDNILEIAPGTGQATRKFVERNYTIHCVELGDKLAQLLRHNMKNKPVTVDVSPFEEWNSQGKTYKLIYCATAWHWLDKEVKYQKTHDLLDDEGYLALLWNNSTGSANSDIMDQAYQLLLQYHGKKTYSTKPKTEEELEEIKHQSKNDIEESGHFILSDYKQVFWSITQSKEKLIKGFYSQSSYLSIPKKDKMELTKQFELLFTQLPETIETYFRSTLYLCKKC